MNSQIWRRGLVAATLTFALLAAAACGGGEETPTPTAVPPTAVPPTAVPPTATAVPPTATAAVAATAAEPPATAEAAAAAEATTSPLAAPESPLAAMESPLAIPELPTPEPQTSDTTGALVGQLVVRGPQGVTPVRDTTIGLAEVIRDEQGVMRVSGYDLATPNRASTDAAGQFVISNVPTGTYTIIVDAVVTQIQLDSAKTGETIIVDIAPNKVTDLGLLSYESLPIPLP